MKKFFKYLLFFVLVFLIVLTITSYQSGQSVEKLKGKYTYPESQFVNIDGMNVHYRKTGSGPPLLLIHGVASSLHTWEAWQKTLSEHFTVISFDVPSFGLTGPHPKGDYSLDMYMKFMDGFVNHLALDSCYMAGNSFGGYLSWNYANHKSDKVKKIILLNAAGISTSKGRIPNLGFLISSHPMTQGISHRITPRLLVSKTVKETYGDPSKVKDETLQLYYDMLTLKGNREGFSEVLRMTKNDKAGPDRIKQVQQPTLIIWGDKDAIIPVEDAALFQEYIPHAQLKIYKGAGHIPMEEIPEISVADALAFLK